MVVDSTPIEHHPNLGLWVKREDLCCPPGPHFSKTRGVLKHIENRPETIIGVLDTSHSQGGWAVAQACRELGKECHLWFPWYKDQEKTPAQQEEAEWLGAILHKLPAGRSAVLYHAAKRELGQLQSQKALFQGQELSTYMMPNALKLPEMVSETRAEVRRTELPPVKTVLISVSSSTIGAGVIAGLRDKGYRGDVVLHMGYSRSTAKLQSYVEDLIGLTWRTLENEGIRILTVDEGYEYKDVAMINPDNVPPWPSNPHYDLKAYQWWFETGRIQHGEALLWNIG